MPTLRHFTVVPRLPAALERLRDIAYNLWWSWAPVAHELFVRVDRRSLGGPSTAIPSSFSRASTRERLEELAADDAFTSHLEAAWSTFQRYMQREGWFSQAPSPRRGRAHRVLLDGVRHPRVLADLLRRPRRPRRRPPEDGERPRAAARRRGPRVRRGVLPAGAQRRRLAGRALPDQRLAPHAGLPRCSTATGKRLIIRVQYPHGIVLRAAVEGAGRSRAAATPRREPRRERAPPTASITGPLYGGDQEFRVRQEIMLGIGGVHALEALGLVADRVPHERGALGVPRDRAHRTRHARTRGPVSRRRRGQQRGQHLHDAHARAGRQRRLRSRRSCGATSSRTARRSASPTRSCSASGRIDAARPVVALLDAGPRDPHVGPLQRREPATRRGLSQDVAGPLARAADARDPHRLHHQRRPHAVVGRLGDGRALHALPRAALGRAARRRGALGARTARSPTPSCGRCTSTGAIAWSSTPGAGCAPRPSGAAPDARSSRWPTRCSIRTR